MKPTDRPSALVIGARGEVGERLLDAALASPAYGRIFAAVAAPFLTSDSKLAAWNVGAADWPAPPDVRDAYILLDVRAGRRDASFRAVGLAELPELAAHLSAYGVKRLVIVAPLAGWLQMSKAASATLGDIDAQFPAMNFETLVVLRPADRNATATSGSLGERIAAGLASTLANIMLPESLQPLVHRDVAKAAILIGTTATPGIRTYDADAIHTILGKRRTRAAFAR